MNPTLPHATGEHGEPPARVAPGRGVPYYLRRALEALASLQVTVVLFGIAIGLVFFGTLAQIDYGIWTVVDQYFASWVVMVPTDLFRKFLTVFWKEAFPPDAPPWTTKFPFPAGFLVGLLMLINLLAAHATRFKLTWKRSGIFLIHGGMILLFVGEFVTRMYAIEQRMTIDEGKAVNFTEDTRTVELAVTDKSQPDTDRVVVIPQNMLKTATGRITHPDLPVDVERVGEYYVNADLEPAAGKPNPATAGLVGQVWTAKKVSEVSGVDTKAGTDLPATYVKLYKKGTDEELGTFLVSLESTLRRVTNEFDLGGKPHEIALRSKRHYKPFSVHLDKFSFDRYMGTSKPKNYSSDVRVFDKDGNLVRQTRIAMNEPLRYAGETFYQADFDKKTEKTTILQVVKNPGMLNVFGLFYASIDYIACATVTLGLLTHFGIYLVTFLTRLRRPAAVPAPEAAVAVAPPAEEFAFSRLFPWLVVGLGALVLLMGLARMNPPREPYNLEAFGRMPVVDGGREKPLDTVARVHLRMISGREEYEDENGKMQPAIRWYLEALSSGSRRHRGAAWKHKIFRIDNEEVLKELKLSPVSGLRYSLDEIGPNLRRIEERSQAADLKVKKGLKPDLTEAKFTELHDRIGMFVKLSEFGGPLLLPPTAEGGQWESLGDTRQRAQQAAFADMRATMKLTPEQMKNLKPEEEAALEAEFDRKVAAAIAQNPVAATWEKLVSGYRDKKPEEFNAAVTEYRTVHAANVTDKRTGKNVIERLLYAPFNAVGHMRVEAMYNRFAPFYQCTGLYVFGFILAAIGYFLSVAEKPKWATALTAQRDVRAGVDARGPHVRAAHPHVRHGPAVRVRDEPVLVGHLHRVGVRGAVPGAGAGVPDRHRERGRRDARAVDVHRRAQPRERGHAGDDAGRARHQLLAGDARHHGDARLHGDVRRRVPRRAVRRADAGDGDPRLVQEPGRADGGFAVRLRAGGARLGRHPAGRAVDRGRHGGRVRDRSPDALGDRVLPRRRGRRGVRAGAAAAARLVGRGGRAR